VIRSITTGVPLGNISSFELLLTLHPQPVDAVNTVCAYTLTRTVSTIPVASGTVGDFVGVAVGTVVKCFDAVGPGTLGVHPVNTAHNAITATTIRDLLSLTATSLVR
jgi:hypothetical protein